MTDAERYTPVPHPVMERMANFGFSKQQSAVFNAVLRKTYGYGKRSDDMTNSQICDATSMDKGNVSRALKQLADLSVIGREKGRFGWLIWVEEDVSKWGQSCQSDNHLELSIQQPELSKQQPKLSDQQLGVVKTTTESCQIDKHKRQLQETIPREEGQRGALPGPPPVEIEEQEEGSEDAPLKPKSPPCPYLEIAKLWNNHRPPAAPTVLHPDKWPDKRKRHVRSLWKGKRLGTDLDEWKAAFSYMATSKFLCGENDRKWVPTFDWAMNDTNLAKLEEDQYHR